MKDERTDEEVLRDFLMSFKRKPTPIEECLKEHLERLKKMGPLLTLLFVPWTVAISTYNYGPTDNGQSEVEVHTPYAQHQMPDGAAVNVGCEEDRDICADYVQAMNDAYKKRTEAKPHETTKSELLGVGTGLGPRPKLKLTPSGVRP